MHKHTFVVESVNSIDAGALVVAAQQINVLGVLDLEGQQQAYGLEGLEERYGYPP